MLRIPLTFGQVIRETGKPLAVPVPNGNSDDELYRTQVEGSFSMRTTSISDDQHPADLSTGSLISEGSTGDCLSCPRVDCARYNGSITSVQMILLLLAVSFSTTLAAQLSEDFKPLIGMLTLTIYMMVGLAVMIAFFNYKRELIVASRENSEDLTDPERDNLTLIGIVIFYLLVCVLDMFHIASALNCREVWTSCSNGDILFHFVVEVFFHVARIAYLGVKTTFCIAFHRSTFKDQVLTRYGLMFLQAVNISLWFDALIQESSELSGEDWQKVNAYKHECRLNGSNISTDVMECLAHNNTSFSQTETIVTTICLPFTIEFTLLVGELLGFCFYHCGGSRTPHGTTAEQPPPNGRVTEGFDARVDSPDEITPLLRSTDEGSSSSSTLYVQVWTAFVIVINVLNCVFTFLCKMKSSEDARYRNVAFYFLFTFWVGMAIAVGVSYYVSRSFRVKGNKTSFSSMDYLLLLTSFGPLAYNALTCIAANDYMTVAKDNIYVTTSFYVTMQVFNAIQVHLQTTFSLFAARITVQDSQHRTREARLFKAIILYLAVSNGSLWFTGTVGGYEFGGLQVGDGMSLQAAYYGRGAWAIIYNIVVPLLLFYRFNSCLVFTRIYRSLRDERS